MMSGVRVTHRETKIANLEFTSAIQQEVCRLDVAATPSWAKLGMDTYARKEPLTGGRCFGHASA